MGYCYGISRITGRQMLACDNCGNIGTTRKRTCPHNVLTSSRRTVDGQRYSLPYCPAPAICAECWPTLRLTAHADCAEGAAISQARYDDEQRKLDAGWHQILSRWGDWHDAVPSGMVGALYGGAKHGEDERYVLVTGQAERADWLEDIPAEAMSEWVNHP